MDSVTKELEEVVMTVTKFGQQQEQGNPAVLLKSQHSSFSWSGAMQDLVNFAQENCSQPLFWRALLLYKYFVNSTDSGLSTPRLQLR